MAKQWTGEFELLYGDTVVGTVTYDSTVPVDTFHHWLGGQFTPTAAFAEIEPWFEELDRLYERDEDDWTEEDHQAQDRIFARISRADFWLRSLDDGSVESIRDLLIESGHRVRWRTTEWQG